MGPSDSALARRGRYHVLYDPGRHRFVLLHAQNAAGTNREPHTLPFIAAASLWGNTHFSAVPIPPTLTQCLCNEFTGTSPPLLTVVDETGSTTGYLQEIQASLAEDGSTPLEIVNQAGMSGGASPPSLFGGGYGGIDLIQNSAATSSANYASPSLQFAAQVWNGSSTQADTWYLQNTPASTGTNPEIMLRISHTGSDYTNPTIQVPSAVNIAAGTDTDLNPQLTVGATPSLFRADLSGVPVTFVGPSTYKTPSSGDVKAGMTQIWPGFVLSSQATGVDYYEGALQIGIALYPNSSDSTTDYLACYTGTQTADVCTSTSQPLLGVFFYTPGSKNSLVALAPPSRALINSFSSSQYSAGESVCRDPNHVDEIVARTSPCQIGQAVGVAVGDYAAGTTHLVDLDFSPQGTKTSSGTESTYATAAPDIATSLAAANTRTDGSGNLTTTGCGAINNTLLTFFCTSTVTAGATLYMFPGAVVTGCTTASSAAIVPVSFSGTVRNLEVFYATPPGTGQTDTFTLLKCPGLASCTATTLTCSISGTTAPSTCSDLTHIASVSQGDGIQITDATGSGSAAANARISIQIQ